MTYAPRYLPADGQPQGRISVQNLVCTDEQTSEPAPISTLTAFVHDQVDDLREKHSERWFRTEHDAGWGPPRGSLPSIGVLHRPHHRMGRSDENSGMYLEAGRIIPPYHESEYRDLRSAHPRSDAIPMPFIRYDRGALLTGAVRKRSNAAGRGKRLWGADEDARLRHLAGSRPENWNMISMSLPGRTGKQCRERWLNHLQAGIRKGGWTMAEDEVILREQAARGNRWSDIARMLPGRSDNAVKNRFNATLKKQLERAEYSGGWGQ